MYHYERMGESKDEPKASVQPERGKWLPEKLEHELRTAEHRVVPAWLRPTGAENRLPPALAIVVAIALQLSLSDKYGLHPRWLLPSLEAALLVALTAINPVRLTRRTAAGRYAAILAV